MHHEAGEDAPKEVSRRSALAVLCGLLSVVVGLMLGIPLVGSFIAPLLAKKKPLWIVLGLPPKESSKPERYTFRYVRIDGWQEKTVYGTAYAVLVEGEILVLSNVCTHLGCGVRWDEEKKQFACPCHNGHFDVHGVVVSGPPPRPLDRYENKLEDGKLRILIKEV